MRGLITLEATKVFETPGTIPEDNASTNSSLAVICHASLFNGRVNTGSLDGMYK